MTIKRVAFLGPMGTYSHLVAEKRFGSKIEHIALPTILDVCTYVAKHSDARGIVPMENSSGGAIYETIDILLANKPRIWIEEELALDVKLALLGHKGIRPRNLYSHFAPLEHCSSWIKKHLPRITRHVEASTAAAAEQAARQPDAAALGSRKLAAMYKLNVLHYPVEADVQNLTVFAVISRRQKTPVNPDRITLAVRIPNNPGALCTFLEAFRNDGIDLSRIISRPIRGCPRQYAFLVDIVGTPSQPNVKRALHVAGQYCTELRIAGIYPIRKPYRS